MKRSMKKFLIELIEKDPDILTVLSKLNINNIRQEKCSVVSYNNVAIDIDYPIYFSNSRIPDCEFTIWHGEFNFTENSSMMSGSTIKIKKNELLKLMNLAKSDEFKMLYNFI